jgi:hypothetical protein
VIGPDSKPREVLALVHGQDEKFDARPAKGKSPGRSIRDMHASPGQPPEGVPSETGVGSKVSLPTRDESEDARCAAKRCDSPEKAAVIARRTPHGYTGKWFRSKL